MHIWTKAASLFFLYILTYAIFVGITTIPTEGDSLGYHIPIARSIISGEFINPDYRIYEGTYAWHRMYFPASGELLLIPFIVFGLPLNLYNVFAWVFLLFCGYFLGTSYKLDRKSALIFAISICMLNTVLRWVNAQTVDIWLAAFFMLSLSLLTKPSRKYTYFLILGICLGFVFGAKYSGAAYVGILILLFGRKVFNFLTFKSVLVFLLPFLTLGLFWYIRNFVVTGNPVYPQSIFGLPGFNYTEINVVDTLINSPLQFFNMFFLELRVWAFIILLPFIYLFFQIVNKQKMNDFPGILLLLGVLNLIVFFFLPSAPEENIHISNVRLGYPAFIPLILSIFIFAEKQKKQELLATITVANMLILPQMQIYPKLVLAYIPLALLLFKIEAFSSLFREKRR